ncbi:ribbon-helix-helix domain-containing protein [Hephaestia caeni]|uniref:ribbon-helix-helix domain-containing protein n=1 Tax=Hephaestia caeni TaxID=645617 RepID=UPI001FEAF823|nr:ribbon-helix-helix domain-containing protein [Hephaestia caeni]
MTGRAIDAPSGGFHGPVKRSVTIAGHQTSISLEPLFWEALEQAAESRALPLNALIAEIDARRIVADVPPNLASALRTWLFSIITENCSQ